MAVARASATTGRTTTVNELDEVVTWWASLRQFEARARAELDNIEAWCSYDWSYRQLLSEVAANEIPYGSSMPRNQQEHMLRLYSEDPIQFKARLTDAARRVSDHITFIRQALAFSAIGVPSACTMPAAHQSAPVANRGTAVGSIPGQLKEGD